MKDFLKIYGRYKKQEPEEDKLDEGSVIVGKFRNNRMLNCWVLLFCLTLSALFILFMNYDIRQNQIRDNSRPRFGYDNETGDYRLITIKPETPREANPYLWPLIIVAFANVVQVVLLFMLYFAKTTVTFIEKDGKSWFQMQGLFFNANIGAPIGCQTIQSITHDRYFIFSFLVLEIYTDNCVYTLAERLEPDFNSGLPIKISYIFGNWFQLTSSQMDGYVTDIARKLGLIKY